MPAIQNTAPDRVILASGSVYRRQLLERLGIDFEVISPDVDETPGADEAAADLAVRLAVAKAGAVAERHPDRIVIGSDQVAEGAGRLLGKPGTVERAIAQLEQLSGRTVVFHTAVAVARGKTTRSALAPTRVRLRELSAEQIRRYVAADQPLDCAGALKSEALGISLAESMTSDDPTALIGLPLISVVSLLAAFGVVIPAPE